MQAVRHLRFLCLLGAAALAGAAEPAKKAVAQDTAEDLRPVPREQLRDQVKADATLRMDFPELGPDRYGKPSSCFISLPPGYDPAKKIPLVVWLAGGDGGNRPFRGFLPWGDFIAVGLPYPKGASNPTQANMVGDFPKVWAYHRTMLDEIHRLLPNIDRRGSIIAGFSNGAHAIDGMLRVSDRGPGLLDYFGAMIFVDGGGTKYTSQGGLPALKGKYAYVCWGEKSPNKQNSSRLARELRSGGASLQANETTGGGHAFDATEQSKVSTWLGSLAPPSPGAR